MAYTVNRLIEGAGINDVDVRPRAALAASGFGVLTEIKGGVKISAIDPVASMQAIDNAALHAVAGQVRDMLVEVVKNV